MKYILILVLTLAIAFTAVAQTENLQVDVTKMTQEQLLVYQQLKMKQASASANVANITPDNVDKYAQVAKGIGVAINEGLGAITKNVEEFVQTRAGMWIAALITWRVAGEDVIGLMDKAVHYAVGIPLLFIGTFMFFYIFRRNCMTRPSLVSVTKVGWFTVKKEYKGVSEPNWCGEASAWTWFCYIVFCIICTFIIFLG